MGPKVTPTAAQLTGSDQRAWAYRICRQGENPWQLRDPPLMKDLPEPQLRVLILSAIGTGNQASTPSPFLHATRSLKKAVWIFSERRALYSNWLVRWPKWGEDSDCLDFEKSAVRYKWLSEADSDNSLLRNYMDKARAYTEKDSELLYFRRPDLGDVQWWDEEGKSWEDCLLSAKSQWWMTNLVSGLTQRQDTSISASLQWHSTMTEASKGGKDKRWVPQEREYSRSGQGCPKSNRGSIRTKQGENAAPSCGSPPWG